MVYYDSTWSGALCNLAKLTHVTYLSWKLFVFDEIYFTLICTESFFRDESVGSIPCIASSCVLFVSPFSVFHYLLLDVIKAGVNANREREKETKTGEVIYI